MLSESDILLRPRIRIKCKIMLYCCFNSSTTSTSTNRQIKTFKIIHSHLHLQLGHLADAFIQHDTVHLSRRKRDNNITLSVQLGSALRRHIHIHMHYLRMYIRSNSDEVESHSDASRGATTRPLSRPVDCRSRGAAEHSNLQTLPR